MIKEFRDFLIQGDVVDVAIGFIFWAAFGTVVKSFVDNVMMPPLGELMWGVDFTSLFIPLDGKSYASLAALEEAGAPAIKYGAFINDFIAFIMLGFGVFMIVKAINKAKKQQEEAPEEPSPEVALLTEIRDSLAK